MAVEITLRLPERLVEHARRFGQATQREVDEVLADIDLQKSFLGSYTLEMMWAGADVLPDWEPPVSTLSDDEVLALADSKMDPAQNEGLGELQTQGKSGGWPKLNGPSY
jgi:hypothetical protein